MGRSKYLTEEQWEKIKPHLPKLSSRGRPWRGDRECLEGILWILRTGARWQDLPDRYPSPSTCWRRLKLWTERGIWLKVWRAFLAELNEQERLDWSEAFKGGLPRQDKTWERHKAYGIGRRPGYSFGSVHSPCQSGGGHAR
jgi:transposase